MRSHTKNHVSKSTRLEMAPGYAFDPTFLAGVLLKFLPNKVPEIEKMPLIRGTG